MAEQMRVEQIKLRELNKEKYKKLQTLTATDRLKYNKGNGMMTKPAVAPGTFALGSMQGARIRAFERRQAAKVEEDKRFSLKRASGAGNVLQQEPVEKTKLR